MVQITSETVEFIRDCATTVSKGQVIREGCRVLSNTPRVAGGGSVKLYDEKKNCLKDKYIKRNRGEFS